MFVFIFIFFLSFLSISQREKKNSTFWIILKNGFVDKNSNLEEKRVCWEMIQVSWVVTLNKFLKVQFLFYINGPLFVGSPFQFLLICLEIMIFSFISYILLLFYSRFGEKFIFGYDGMANLQLFFCCADLS